MSAIDRKVAEQLAAAMPRDEFLRLIETFETDLGRLAQDCVRAASSPEPAALQRAAHSLAGAAAGIGAHALEAAARSAMTGAPVESVAVLVARIQAEADTVLAELAILGRKRPTI